MISNEPRDGAGNELRVGSRIEANFGPITRTGIVRYAGASGDFNAVHHDEILARSKGYPSVFAMGLYPAGVLAMLVTDWLGLNALRQFRVRFVDRIWPGESLTLSATVRDLAAASGHHSLQLTLAVVNEKSVTKIAGNAHVVIP